jgi:uncharacterized membrane protein YeaQ/YmgE (transglycosylase-associated protein family)
MGDAIVQVVPMLILAGLVVAWLAEVLSRAGGYGFLPDIVLGLGGSLVVGAIFWAVISPDLGMVVMLMIGCVGGALAVTVQRQLVRSARAAD